MYRFRFDILRRYGWVFETANAGFGGGGWRGLSTTESACSAFGWAVYTGLRCRCVLRFYAGGFRRCLLVAVPTRSLKSETKLFVYQDPSRNWCILG